MSSINSIQMKICLNLECQKNKKRKKKKNKKKNKKEREKRERKNQRKPIPKNQMKMMSMPKEKKTHRLEEHSVTLRNKKNIEKI
jgi:hypothetical protein